MAQLNIEIDNELHKRVRLACIEDNTKLKKWVSAALELALDFDETALARCKELGWTPPGQEPVEIIDQPSRPKRVKKF